MQINDFKKITSKILKKQKKKRAYNLNSAENLQELNFPPRNGFFSCLPTNKEKKEKCSKAFLLNFLLKSFFTLATSYIEVHVQLSVEKEVVGW